MNNYLTPVYTLGLVGFLLRGAYVSDRKCRMVDKSSKKFSALQRVLKPEVRECIITRKSEENTIEEACATSNHLLVYGPKKVGKSTLLKKMTENQFENKAIYVNVEMLSTEQAIYNVISNEVGYDPIIRELGGLNVIFNVSLWFKTEKIEYYKFGNYLEDVSVYYQAHNEGVRPILIIDGLKAVANKHPHVIRDLLNLAKHLSDEDLMNIILVTSDGKAAHMIKTSRVPSRTHIWMNECTQKEIRDLIENGQKGVVEKAYNEFKAKEEKHIDTEELVTKAEEVAQKEGARFRQMAEELNNTLIGNNIYRMSYFIKQYKINPATAKDEFTKERLDDAKEQLSNSGFKWAPQGFKENKKGGETVAFNLLLEKKIFPKLLKDGKMSEIEYYQIMIDYQEAAEEFATKEVLVSYDGMIFFLGKEMEVYLAQEMKTH